MSSVTLCVYCEQLPVQTPGSSARVTHCPLCHSQIGSTRAGATFRVVEGGAPVRRASRGVVCVLGTIGLAGVVALGLLLRSPGHLGQPAQLPAQVESSVPVNLPEEASALSAPATPAHETPNPDAAVKPFGSTWRFRPPIKGSPYPGKVAAEAPASDTAPSFGSARPYYGQGPSYDLALLNLLKQAPEIALHEPFPKTISKTEARARIAKFLESALVMNRSAKEADAFVKNLLETRADLDGLPFLLGKACRLEPEKAARLAVAAAMVRSPVGRGGARTTTMSMATTSQETYPFGEFWRQWTSAVDLRSMAGRLPDDGRNSRNTTWNINAAHVQTGIGALSQILGGEEPRFRKALVMNLVGQENSFAAKTLAKFAVFDADHEVREIALVGLRHRRAEDYVAELAAAVRYPWAPAARHAAEALVRLEVKEAIPSLIDFLDEPNPAAPFAVEKKGKKVFAIRELVRVNHHRNCQLCHAPADPSNRDDPGQVLAMTPIPGEPLPPSISLVYYSSQRSGIVAVRADTTYLRQDFSALLPVADAEPWPEQQRFDFLIRTRVLSAEETAMRQGEAEPKCSSPHHEAALTALRQLTGHDLGPDAEAWRRLGGDGAFSRGVNKPAWGR